MIKCQFPYCSAVLHESTRGYFVKKYCSPHSDVIYKAKRKQHLKNQVERKKVKLLAKKLELDPKCKTCGISIMSFSLKKKYCQLCEKISGNTADKKFRKNKNVRTVFNNIRRSLETNTIILLKKE